MLLTPTEVPRLAKVLEPHTLNGLNNVGGVKDHHVASDELVLVVLLRLKYYVTPEVGHLGGEEGLARPRLGGELTGGMTLHGNDSGRLVDDRFSDPFEVIVPSA